MSHNAQISLTFSYIYFCRIETFEESKIKTAANHSSLLILRIIDLFCKPVVVEALSVREWYSKRHAGLFMSTLCLCLSELEGDVSESASKARGFLPCGHATQTIGRVDGI